MMAGDDIIPTDHDNDMENTVVQNVTKTAGEFLSKYGHKTKTPRYAQLWRDIQNTFFPAVHERPPRETKSIRAPRRSLIALD